MKSQSSSNAVYRNCSPRGNRTLFEDGARRTRPLSAHWLRSRRHLGVHSGRSPAPSAEYGSRMMLGVDGGLACSSAGASESGYSASAWRVAIRTAHRSTGARRANPPPSSAEMIALSSTPTPRTAAPAGTSAVRQRSATARDIAPLLARSPTNSAALPMAVPPSAPTCSSTRTTAAPAVSDAMADKLVCRRNANSPAQAEVASLAASNA
jgi:hypothetical protein